MVVNADQDDKGVAVNITAENVNTYTVITKTRLLDHWLDKVVEFSSSQFIFFTIVAALLT